MSEISININSHQDGPLVSVITPAYNAASFIGETLDSVVSQTFKNWELIVIDDGSTDDTCDIVQQYSVRNPRIRLVRLETNNGAPAIPRNTGIANAKGDWIALLDADDLWHPKKLELQLSLLDENNFDFVCSRMIDFTRSDTLSYEKNPDPKYRFVSYHGQKIKGKIPASSVIARKEIFSEFPFEEALEYKAVEDYHCWLRVLKKYRKVVKINTPLLFYHVSDAQISKSKLTMMKKIYMVHKNSGKYNFFPAIFFTVTHVVFAYYYRYLKKGL